VWRGLPGIRIAVLRVSVGIRHKGERGQEAFWMRPLPIERGTDQNRRFPVATPYT
jgi:hypothetical protein